MRVDVFGREGSARVLVSRDQLLLRLCWVELRVIFTLADLCFDRAEMVLDVVALDANVELRGESTNSINEQPLAL